MTTASRVRRIRRDIHRDRARRNLHLETLEDRRVMAVMIDTFDDVVADDGYTSLREAISLVSNDGVSDAIVLPHAIEGVEGTYALSLGELAIDDADALTIQSDGGPATIDAQGLSRVFSIAVGSDVTLTGLVMTRGYSPEPAAASSIWVR